MMEFNHLAQIIAAMQKASEQIIKKGAFDIQAQAMDNITANDQVDTGFMKSSVYVVTYDSSTYGRASASGSKRLDQHNSKNGTNVSRELLPEVEKPSRHTEALVAVGAEYGIFQEMGTEHQPARPYLVPAFETVSPTIIAAMGKLEAKIVENFAGAILNDL